MKKAIAYLFLCVYVFAQVKPLSIIVTDVFAHVFFERSHLATVHFENGHYHVHNEIAKAENESKSDKAKSAVNSSENDDAECREGIFIFQQKNNQSNLTLKNPAGNIPAGFQIISSPPPELL